MTIGRKDEKPLIGVLASHDDPDKNKLLVALLEELYGLYRSTFRKFHFVFTGGTFDRIVDTREFRRTRVGRYLLDWNATCLPDREHGGVPILANLVVQRQCRILWPFLSPITAHWLNPENLALMRLCDIWKDKRLMNCGSVESWFHYEAQMDSRRNLQTIPISMRSGLSPDPDPQLDVLSLAERDPNGFYRIEPPKPIPRESSLWHALDQQTIALIAHDEMKGRMVDFAVEYEDELARFKRILTTGTTGQQVLNATRSLKDIVKRCRSGPKGGDIEIANEVLFSRCHVVVFFVDPLNPHPHIEDIRVVFAACMIENNVRMLTNEVQAREWMDRVAR
jgi:methylglyoxal synthase